jgi:hypothetical protein
MVITTAAASSAHAFDTKGHAVIEALAYRTLVEGHGMQARPEVLRDLINDGALDTPWCFGSGTPPTVECRDARSDNPLLFWPQPESDRPDLFFRRQFSDSGQCFHYMGTLTDAVSEPLFGTSVPRDLATSAITRCNDLLQLLLRQVVVVGGSAPRRNGFGLYELMHAVADSFSLAHAERTSTGIRFLRVWKPIERLVRLPTERAKKIPTDAYHRWNDHRDKTYITLNGPQACEKRTDHPYNVPYECLSEEGDRARQALVELLVLVRDLRLEKLAAPPGVDTHPETSAEWRSYVARWFTSEYRCEGAECTAREPAETAPGRYAFLGLDLRVQTPSTYEVTARASVLRFAQELNPFVYGLSASLGYQYRNMSGNACVVGLGLDLVLPVGLKAGFGLKPAEIRVVFGSFGENLELLTRLLQFNYPIGGGFELSLEAPLAVNWVQLSAHWSLGVGVSYGLSSRKLVTGDTVIHGGEEMNRLDEEWEPPPAPYGHLRGRKTTVGVIAGISPTTVPVNAVAGESYGLGMLGAELVWDTDRWARRYPVTPAILLSAGLRKTSGESMYSTGTAAFGLRWYFLGPLGVSVTPVRVEGGPKVLGKGEADVSVGVHGSLGSEYYLLAGSRAGLAVRFGVLDLLLDSPTIAWNSDPFGAHELLSFTLGVRL